MVSKLSGRRLPKTYMMQSRKIPQTRNSFAPEALLAEGKSRGGTPLEM